jgi:hypothetical protein
MTEVMQDGQWNMQYFGTAQGAVCTALHHLLLQARQEQILIFPALPAGWDGCSFERLLAAGCQVSARFDQAHRLVEGSALNASNQPLQRRLICGENSAAISLAPGESHAFHWTI